MLTVLSVFGTRPEAIKMAPVVRELERYTNIRSIVCVTGQHREMLDQVLKLFAIRPEIDLQVMKPDQSLGQLTASLFAGLDRVVAHVKPDWLLAQGDTTTVAVSALTAFYHRVRFGHVEAGLRSKDKWRPFPEEVNRRVADLVADAYFAPTALARTALLDEGCDPATVYLTGNTVIDALMDVASRPFDWDTSGLPSAERCKRLVLITAHRRESFGGPFRELCVAIRTLAERFPDVHFLYPVHRNPNVVRPVTEILGALPNVTLIDPLDYVSMVHAMKGAELILTDSGGIQEEAPAFGIPVLVMRETTERPEGVTAGVVKLVGTSQERIVSEAARLLGDPAARSAWPRNETLYGDGRAAQRIVDVLREA